MFPRSWKINMAECKYTPQKSTDYTQYWHLPGVSSLRVKIDHGSYYPTTTRSEHRSDRKNCVFIFLVYLFRANARKKKRFLMNDWWKSEHKTWIYLEKGIKTIFWQNVKIRVGLREPVYSLPTPSDPRGNDFQSVWPQTLKNVHHL